MYAIVDIETTGGNPLYDRITEVAIIMHDGVQKTREYHTLINPERSIPGFITGLTGITAEMVAEAPTFDKVADELNDLLSDKVFIAHNANFDYGFLREEFKKVNLKFDRPKLCTVRLGRKIFPGLGSYSLGRLCSHVGIVISDRHRAFGDASATAKLFDMMLAADEGDVIRKSLKRNSGESFLPPNIAIENYRDLPEKPGVYYFHDAHGKVIYVGKALNIKSRFKGHFTGGSKSNPLMKTEIHAISYELTGSEFLALLLEALEIKRLWPKFNRSQKVRSAAWGLYSYEDGAGYIRLQVSKVKSMFRPLVSFSTHSEMWSFLLEKISEFDLCPKLCGVQKSNGPCYAYQEGKCKGACGGHEDAADYNEKMDRLVQSLSLSYKRILIKERGRDEEEEAAIFFEQGVLHAYGFIDREVSYANMEEAVSCLKQVKPIRETGSILKTYLMRFPSNIVEMTS